ncbi:PrsW family intramembrane metalloprotease [Clostridium sp. MSJ-11]|uniref:PrsW family intramembrane metalloprotease n=1 Tax=Clostridium mobile TaxID=2841512 RepID=A0ABS6EM31_9CLOT|nr:PrsW family glutamic-type intramembrane protease [Clostridium mobile]MBU5485812.1 PrsW family intramembrane metalloprotease [Clostridium mobile]
MENVISVKKKKYKWHKLLSIGLATYILGVIVLILTGNIVLFPAVVMLGNFLIPVTYVSFFYEKRNTSNVTMTDVVATFFYGGFLGTFAASILEPIFITSLNFRTAVMVGLIEEFTKILGVLFIYRRKRHRLHMDGIILGAAAGMGFAALESTGYAFSTFLRSRGSLSLTVYITLMRGILSPLGHGTWTAILAGVFAKENIEGPLKINGEIISAYIIVVLLHTLWNSVPTVMSILFPFSASVLVSELIIGAAGIIILMVQWNKANKSSYSL